MWRRIAPAERDATAPRVPRSPPRALRGIVTACLLLVPLAAWLARHAGWTRLGDALAFAMILLALGVVVRTLGALAALACTLALAVLVGFGFVLGVPAVYGPPVAINFAIAALFAASLRHDEALVTRFARLEGTVITPKVARYTRRLTLVWALYLCALGVTGILIALHGDERMGAWWAGLIDYLLIAMLFVGELVYRRRSARALIDQVRHVRAAMRRPSA